MMTKEIAQALAARLTGDGALEIERIVHPDDAEGAGDLAIAMTADSAAALARTKAQAVVVSARRPPAPDRFKAVILIEQPRYALAILTALFDPGPTRTTGIHPSAIVAPDASLGENVSVGAYAVIGPRTRIGARSVILPHVTIGADVAIGEQGLIHSGVRIGDRVAIGDRVLIKHNASIGSDGFSFAPELGPRMPYPADLKLARVHSLGRVIIGDDVEIGAGTSIDRATLEATRIGNGTKIDSHVHVGHNVTIGESCIICGKVGISGSVTMGDRVRIGGGAGIADHLTIGSEAIVGAGSGVGTNVPERTFVFGYPAMRHDRMMEIIQNFGRQRALHNAVDDIQARLAQLEQAIKI